jgi:hypothetical protein
MTTTTEPRITVNTNARTITADFLVSTDNGGRDGEERREYASFRVGYTKGGINYFSGNTSPRSYYSSISRVTEETIYQDGRRIGTSQSFTLFEGLGLTRSEPVARFSQKGLRAYFDEVFARLDGMREDPRVAKFFELESA